MLCIILLYSSPNIRDHNITDVSVTGLREYNNIIVSGSLVPKLFPSPRGEEAGYEAK